MSRILEGKKEMARKILPLLINKEVTYNGKKYKIRDINDDDTMHLCSLGVTMTLDSGDSLRCFFFLNHSHGGVRIFETNTDIVLFDWDTLTAIRHAHHIVTDEIASV